MLLQPPVGNDHVALIIKRRDLEGNATEVVTLVTKDELRGVQRPGVLTHFGVPGGKKSWFLATDGGNVKSFHNLVAENRNRSTRVQEGTNSDLFVATQQCYIDNWSQTRVGFVMVLLLLVNFLREFLGWMSRAFAGDCGNGVPFGCQVRNVWPATQKSDGLSSVSESSTKPGKEGMLC